jgi:hypothetical protein
MFACCVLTVLLASPGARGQSTQTEIDWVEEASTPSKAAASSQTAKADPSAASNTSGLRLRLGTSMFSRYELRRNYARLEPSAPDDRIRDFDAIAYRARMVFGTEPLQLAKGLSVDVALVPQASGFWAPSGINADAALTLHEGYVRPYFGDRAWLQIGRFEMSYGDEWLIGANGWHETARSFDGARFHVSGAGNAAFVDVFFSMLREGRTASAATTSNDRLGSGDEMLLGIYGDLGPLLSEHLHLDPYALLVLAPRSGRYYPAGSATPVEREAAAEATLGLRIKGVYGVVDYRIEGSFQVGQRTAEAFVADALGGAADAEVGFRLPATIRLAAEGLFASGDDPTTSKDEGYADRFSQPHKWLGLSDMFRTRTNVTGVAAHLSATPADGLSLGVQGHFLFKVRVVDAQDPQDVSAGYAGTEVDPYLSYSFGQGLALNTEYGLFIPSKETYGRTRTAHFLGVQFGFEYPG